MKRAIALAVFLLAGCSEGLGATARPDTSPTVISTAPPTPSPVASTVYTASDVEIATLIRAAADEAIPQLEVLNNMSPDKLEDLFIPLGTWITSQKGTIEAYAPSGCTADAVELFLDGMDEYDSIRKTFLEWRDWGANGHPFSPGAPRKAVTMFDEALVALEAQCPD